MTVAYVVAGLLALLVFSLDQLIQLAEDSRVSDALSAVERGSIEKIYKLL